MPYMRTERPSRKWGCSRWKQLLNISNLPRNVTAWLRMRSRNGIGKFWKRWLKFGGNWRETPRPRAQKSNSRRPLLRFHRPFSRPPNAATPAPCARAERARSLMNMPAISMHSRANRRYCSDLDIEPESPVTLAATPKRFRRFPPILSSIPKSRQTSKDECLRARAATCD